MSDPQTRCTVCGYELGGLAPDNGQVRCPECGESSALVRAAAIGRMPSVLRLVWSFGSPVVWLLPALAAPVLVAKHHQRIDASMMTGFAFLTLWLLVAIVHVPFTANAVATAHAPSRARRRAVVRLLMIGAMTHAAMLILLSGCLGIWHLI